MKLVLCFALLQIMGSCGGGSSGGDGGGDPPDPPTYDYVENEPNNTLEDAQFITVLPTFALQNIGGTLWVPQDTDCYAFFLSPPIGDSEVNFNIALETDPILNPKIRLYQTVVDDTGTPTGYQLLGTWVGLDGELGIFDFEVPYDAFYNNDLLLKLEGWGGLMDVPLPDDTYTLEFWSN